MAATGTCPVDAMYKAIDQIVGVKVVLKEYSLQGVTEGIEALATTKVVIEHLDEGLSPGTVYNAQGPALARTFSGLGSDTDIIVSSTRAYTRNT